MPLQDFDLQNKPNKLAMIEQAFILLCLGKNHRVRLESWLATHRPGTAVVVWVHRPAARHPSYCILRENQRLFVSVYGTTNFWPQVREEIAQAKGESIGGHVFEHGYFQEVALAIMADIDRLYPDISSFQLNFASHSLGCGVSQIAGVRYQDKYPDMEVNLLCFAAPRAITVNDKRKHPKVWYRIAEPDDIVNDLPSKYIDFFLKGVQSRSVVPLVGIVNAHVWEHYGRKFEFFAFDNLVEIDSQSDSWWSVFNWESTIAYLHYMSNYARQSVRIYKATYPDNPDTVLMDLIFQTIAGGDGFGTNTEVPEAGYITPADYPQMWEWGFGIPFEPIILNKAEFARMRALGVTTKNSKVLPPLPQNILPLIKLNLKKEELDMAVANYTATFFINNGLYGASQRHTLITGKTESQARALALDLAYARSWLLGNNVASVGTATVKSLACPVIEFLRLSSAIQPDVGSVEKLDASSYGGARGITTNGADNYASTLTIQMRGQNSADPAVFSTSTLYIVGQPDPCVKNGEYDGTVAINNGKSFNQNLLDYLGVLTNGNWGFCAHHIGHPYKIATSVSKHEATGLVQATCTNHGFEQGTKVQIKGSSVPELNKTFTVQLVDANTFRLQRSTKYALDLPTQFEVKAIESPTGERYVQWYKYVSFSTPKVGGKHRGKQFLNVSFRPRGRRR